MTCPVGEADCPAIKKLEKAQVAPGPGHDATDRRTGAERRHGGSRHARPSTSGSRSSSTPLSGFALDARQLVPAASSIVAATRSVLARVVGKYAVKHGFRRAGAYRESQARSPRCSRRSGCSRGGRAGRRRRSGRLRGGAGGLEDRPAPEAAPAEHADGPHAEIPTLRDERPPGLPRTLGDQPPRPGPDGPDGPDADPQAEATPTSWPSPTTTASRPPRWSPASPASRATSSRRSAATSWPHRGRKTILNKIAQLQSA